MHTPYRAWCEACLRGRGRSADQKRLTAGKDYVIETVSVDCVFFLREHMCRWTEEVTPCMRDQSSSWHEESVKQVSDEDHVIKVTVNMGGIARL